MIAYRCFPPDPAALGAVRAFAEQHLDALGLAGRREEMELVVTELASNAIIHAGTDFEVRLVALTDGGRIEVVDGSTALPTVGTPAPTAMTGRGLVLVQALAVRWGAHRDPDAGRECGLADGKIVWCDLASTPPEPAEEPDMEALLAMWAEDCSEPLAPAPDPPGRTVVAAMTDVVLPPMPVEGLLAAQAHVDDLIRELQLILLTHPLQTLPVQTPPDDGPAEQRSMLLLAARLDAAARQFAEARRQIRAQTLAATARGQDQVILCLRFPAHAVADVADAAIGYLQAIEALDQAGPGERDMLTGPGFGRHGITHRRYLAAVIHRLSRHRSGPGPVTNASR